MENILYAVLWFIVLGGSFGLILAILSKKLYVQEDERLSQILENLPGANCGGCGFTGCAGLAAAILKGEAGPEKCAGCNSEGLANICRIMQIPAVSVQRKRAEVMCSGGNAAKNKFIYEGIRDCRIAAKLSGGNKFCPDGCTGLGNCARACAFDALKIVDGRAVVNAKLCRGCGVCVNACPKNLIELVPYDAVYTLGCKSREKGAVTIKICDVGCIGCKKCEKDCPARAITVNECHAKIDYSKCTHCGKCAEVCGRGIIRKWTP